MRQGPGAPVRQVASAVRQPRPPGGADRRAAARSPRSGAGASCSLPLLPLATMASRGELSTKLLKLLLLGNSTVGKTSLMLRFCEDSFTLNFSPTIGVGARSPSALRLL